MAHYERIHYEHIVVFEKDSTIFAAGRTEDNHIRLFLINERTGNVYSRNGRIDSWEELYGEPRGSVLEHISCARFNKTIPVFSIRGYCTA